LVPLTTHSRGTGETSVSKYRGLARNFLQGALRPSRLARWIGVRRLQHSLALSPHTPNLQIRLERISKLVGAPYEQSDYAAALKELRPLTRLRIFQQPAKLN